MAAIFTEVHCFVEEKLGRTLKHLSVAGKPS